MNNTGISRVLNSATFKMYGNIITAGITGGTFVFFLFSNHMTYLRQQNEDLEKNYKLSQEVEQKKCENEKTQMKIDLESSMLIQYKKFDKDSKESHLFLETMELLSQKGK